MFILDLNAISHIKDSGSHIEQIINFMDDFICLIYLVCILFYSSVISHFCCFSSVPMDISTFCS